MKALRELFSIIILIPLLSSCTSAENRDQDNNRSLEKDSSPTTQIIEDSELPYRWSQTAVEIQREKRDVTSKLEPVQNRHNPNVIDTIETYTDLDTKVEIYHSNDKRLLMSASIHQKKVLPRGIVNVGSTRADVADWIDRRVIGDILIIKDEQGHNTLTFTFARDTVKHIEFQGYVD